MRKGVVIIIAAAIVLIAGVLIIVASQSQQSQQQTQSGNTTQSAIPPANTKAETTNSIAIRNMDFTPTKTTVVKGTVVTWTNDDNIGHNVVASDPNNTGGLPLSAPLLKKGETYSLAFNEVGNFAYHCAPHPTMRGAIEVIEQ